MGRKRNFSQEKEEGSEKLSPASTQSKLEEFFAPLKRQSNNECLEAFSGEIGCSLQHSPAAPEEVRGGYGISNPAEGGNFSGRPKRH